MDGEVECRDIVLRPGHHNRRLDQVLVDLVPELSRSYLQQLIALGAVKLNTKVCSKPAQRAKVGDMLNIELRPTPQSQAFKAESMALDVAYQDAHLLVINKPAGLVVHPAPGNWAGTLMNGLLALDSQAFMLPRAGIVHRLDKDTSGLMVVARTRGVMDALVKAIADRSVKRQYLALVHGQWTSNMLCEVKKPIGRDPSNRLRMAVVDLSIYAGKTAHTNLQCLDTCASGSLVHCRLQTGRTHQIRVHLASMGHPLVGDVIYGGVPALGLSRQALHAVKLSFLHPVTAEPLVLFSPPPPDFESALVSLGLKYNPLAI